MAELRIEHGVPDFDAWKSAAFVRDPRARIVETAEEVDLRRGASEARGKRGDAPGGRQR